MDTAERLEEQLQDTLTHLHDRDYQPSQLLYAVTGCDPHSGAIPVRSAIIREIERLEPGPDIPRGAYIRRVYDVLHYRYVLKLTLEETAERLNLSVRHVTRVQRDAVCTLARALWERGQTQRRPTEEHVQAAGVQPLGEEGSAPQAPNWRAQIRRELASLQAIAPDAVCDVGEVIKSVLELKSALTARGDVHVEVGFVQPNLITATHPSVLRQILITAMGRLARYTSPGQITVFAGLEDGNVKVTIIGSIDVESRPTESDLIRDILVLEHVSVEAHIEEGHVFLWVELPCVGKVTVLAVDDNPDMADFYRRSAEGTGYHIVHTAEGQGLFEVIKATTPDIIVLDVILPDVDGWELLMRLHEDPETCTIPVVVCSVVREEALALSLGAARHLSKPVQPCEFIQALDQVLVQAPTAATRDPTNSVTAC